MFKKTTCWIVLIYGLLLIAGGYMGFTKGSLPSLYIGCGSGTLIVISSLLLFAKKQAGTYISVFSTLILAATFGFRYSLTSKPIPAIFAVLSGSMLIFLLVQSAQWKKKKK